MRSSSGSNVIANHVDYRLKFHDIQERIRKSPSHHTEHRTAIEKKCDSNVRCAFLWSLGWLRQQHPSIDGGYSSLRKIFFSLIDTVQTSILCHPTSQVNAPTRSMVDSRCILYTSECQCQVGSPARFWLSRSWPQVCFDYSPTFHKRCLAWYYHYLPHQSSALHASHWNVSFIAPFWRCVSRFVSTWNRYSRPWSALFLWFEHYPVRWLHVHY